ncbi:hypothetical protein ACNSPD_04085 [Yersinia enterocolitica]|uniref:hypothetical protein n=1 Tax=Yersinia enterocolitica TaxID=630 RepID=UPI003AB37FCC
MTKKSMKIGIIAAAFMLDPTAKAAFYVHHLAAQSMRPGPPWNNQLEQIAINGPAGRICSFYTPGENTTRSCSFWLGGYKMYHCTEGTISECSQKALSSMMHFPIPREGTQTWERTIRYSESGQEEKKIDLGNVIITVATPPTPQCHIFNKYNLWDLGVHPREDKTFELSSPDALWITCNTSQRVKLKLIGYSKWVDIYHKGSPLALGATFSVRPEIRENFELTFRARLWEAPIGRNMETFIVKMTID